LAAGVNMDGAGALMLASERRAGQQGRK